MEAALIVGLIITGIISIVLICWNYTIRADDKKRAHEAAMAIQEQQHKLEMEKLKTRVKKVEIVQDSE